LLNSPIGATIAPADFGQFSNDVLIGNFGDSHVNAFDPATGAFLGQLTDTQGNPLVLNGGFKQTDTKGLWGIGFGNGAGSAGTKTLFFASGINQENDGLFGSVNMASTGSDPPADPLSRHDPLHVVASPSIPNSALNATTAIAANDQWAVGDVLAPDGTPSSLAEHFDGTSWSVVATPTVSGSSLYGLAAASSSDVWAVGSQGFPNNQPLIENWNGTNWSVVKSPRLSNGGVLVSVTVVSPNNIWAAGVSGTSDALVEHWDGTKWSVASSSAFTGAGRLEGISADASNDIWAVGSTSGPSAPTVLHFDGTSWSKSDVSQTAASFLNGVTVLSTTNVWAVGGETIGSGRHAHTQTLILHWDGTSWSVVPSPTTTASSVPEGISAISANDIWVVGTLGAQTLAEHWDGASWSIVDSPNPGKGGNRLFGVTTLSTGLVTAVGQQFDSSGVSTGLIVSNN
jgi:hypothetical protein